MLSQNLISWLFRIALACLAFCVVWFGLPWALQTFFHITWPDPVIGLLALLAFLAVLSHYWWGRKGVVVACLPVISVLICLAVLFTPALL